MGFGHLPIFTKKFWDNFAQTFLWHLNISTLHKFYNLFGILFFKFKAWPVKGEIKPKADWRARRAIDSTKKRTNSVWLHYVTTLHGKKNPNPSVHFLGESLARLGFFGTIWPLNNSKIFIHFIKWSRKLSYNISIKPLLHFYSV